MSIAALSRVFPQFYENPLIQALSTESRWTISGQIGDLVDNPSADEAERLKARKAPIDLRALLDIDRLRGAWATDERCLVTLDELTTRIPSAANHAFYLSSYSDGVLVIDIERQCPAHIAHQLLQLPDVMYSETSMSGLGFHLVVPLPPNFFALQNDVGKRVYRHEHGWYEVLVEHWITFTRNPIPAQRLNEVRAAYEQNPGIDPALSSTEALFAYLAEHAAATSAASTEIATTEQMPEIPYAAHIIDNSLLAAESRLKTPEAFNHDLSRWEFSVLGTIYQQMRPIIQNIEADVSPQAALSFSDSDRTWMLFTAATQVIPHRPKHNERRNGRPFMLDRAAALIASHHQRDT